MELKTVRTLLGLIRPYRWALPWLVALGVLASFSEGLGIGLLIPLLGTLLGSEMPAGASGPLVTLVQRYATLFGEETRLAVLGGSIIVLIVLKSVILYASNALFIWINGRASHDIRCGLHRQLLRVGYIFFARNDPGRLLNTLSMETWYATEAINAFFWILIHGCTVAVFAVILLLISWQLTLTVVIGVLLASLAVRLIARRTRRLSDAWVTADAELAERMVDAVSGMRVIRAFGQEARMHRRFAEASDRVRAVFVASELVSGLTLPLLEILYAPLFLGVLLLAWYMGLGVPAVLAFLLMLYRLQLPISRLDRYRVQLAARSGAVAEVADLLDERDKPYIRSGTIPFDGLRSSVTFRNVTFRYDPEACGPPALAGVSFEIRKGEVTAVVGDSGAGKSTLINLLCRFYDPDDGEILVDGRPLRDLDLGSWLARIAIAGQDADLLGGTVLENIAFGRRDADRAAITAAARQADAHDFVQALPLDYDTRVGQRGLSLSGGQRQRIGLARALVRDPDLLLLDEATNALDSLSQNAIQETLERLAGRTTVVVIAHRLSTIRNADRVIVLGDGRVVEQGRPADLSRADGPFARLYRLEAAGLRAPVPDSGPGRAAGGTRLGGGRRVEP